MPRIVDHFDALADQGLKVIPLRANSKVPMCKAWSKHWNKDTARSKLEIFPDANIGLLLGDVVDVEGDSEEANNIIIDLIGKYPHPNYQSTKSIHHLFLNPDPKLRHFRWQNIEFRGHGHQSVLPPSHHAGIVYKWMNDFKFPVPPMPDKLTLFYENKVRVKHRRSKIIKPGHMKTWCSLCRNICYLHKKRFDLEIKAFKLLSLKWECHKCRSYDLRTACRLIRAGAPDKIVITNTLQKI